MNPCPRCGHVPSLRTIDVTSVSVAHYLRCECGRGTSWKFNPDACTAEWNKMNPAQAVEPVQTKASQPSRHMSVLAKRKAVLGCA